MPRVQFTPSVVHTLSLQVPTAQDPPHDTCLLHPSYTVPQLNWEVSHDVGTQHLLSWHVPDAHWEPCEQPTLDVRRWVAMGRACRSALGIADADHAVIGGGVAVRVRRQTQAAPRPMCIRRTARPTWSTPASPQRLYSRNRSRRERKRTLRLGWRAGAGPGRCRRPSCTSLRRSIRCSSSFRQARTPAGLPPTSKEPPHRCNSGSARRPGANCRRSLRRRCCRRASLARPRQRSHPRRGRPLGTRLAGCRRRWRFHRFRRRRPATLARGRCLLPPRVRRSTSEGRCRGRRLPATSRLNSRPQRRGRRGSKAKRRRVREHNGDACIEEPPGAAASQEIARESDCDSPCCVLRPGESPGQEVHNSLRAKHTGHGNGDG